jgi:hypothetical protein
MVQFVIEHDVPLVDPKDLERGGAKQSKYPFAEMQVGDSFAFDAPPPLGERMRGRASAYGRANGKKFVVRIGHGKGRCWRVA